VSAVDSFDYIKGNLQNPADSSTVSDSTSVGVGKAVFDTASTAEAAFISFLRTLTDSAVTGDTQALAVGKIAADVAAPSDSGVLVNQGYCDIIYFAEDYVGQRITF
jgi:hypothetical protein